MSRTTGYTATAAANLFLDGLFTEKGIFPPELVGKHERCFNYILNYLEERNVIYKDHSALWKIIKEEETYLILNHRDEEVDRSESFEEAYSLLNQYKNSKK